MFFRYIWFTRYFCNSTIYPKLLCLTTFYLQYLFHIWFLFKDFSLTRWSEERGLVAGNLDPLSLSVLFEDISISTYVLENQCTVESNANHWTSGKCCFKDVICYYRCLMNWWNTTLNGDFFQEFIHMQLTFFNICKACLLIFSVVNYQMLHAHAIFMELLLSQSSVL